MASSSAILPRDAKRARIDDDGAPHAAFPFDDLLPELQGVSKNFMAPLSRALLAFTNKQHLCTSYHADVRSTSRLLCWAAADGDYALFCAIEDEFGPHFAGDPLPVLEAAIKGHHPEFLVAFLSDEGHHRHLLHDALREAHRPNEYSDLLQVVGSHGTYEIAMIFVNLFGYCPLDECPTRLGETRERYIKRLLRESARHSNLPLLKALMPHTSFLSSEADPEFYAGLTQTAFSSCNRTTMDVVLSQLKRYAAVDMADPAMLAARTEVISIPAVDLGPCALTPATLLFMNSHKCAPGFHGAIANALRYKNRELLEFVMGRHGPLFKLAGHEEIFLAAFETAAHREIFEVLFGAGGLAASKLPRNPVASIVLEANTTTHALAYFTEKGIIAPGVTNINLYFDSSYEATFWLIDNGFSIPSGNGIAASLLRDTPEALMRVIHHPLMVSGRALFATMSTEGSQRILPELLATGMLTIRDALVETLCIIANKRGSAWRETEDGQTQLTWGGHGLLQLHAIMRWLCFRALHPLYPSEPHDEAARLLSFNPRDLASMAVGFEDKFKATAVGTRVLRPIEPLGKVGDLIEPEPPAPFSLGSVLLHLTAIDTAREDPCVAFHLAQIYQFLMDTRAEFDAHWIHHALNDYELAACVRRARDAHQPEFLVAILEAHIRKATPIKPDAVFPLPLHEDSQEC